MEGEEENIERDNQTDLDNHSTRIKEELMQEEEEERQREEMKRNIEFDTLNTNVAPDEEDDDQLVFYYNMVERFRTGEVDLSDLTEEEREKFMKQDKLHTERLKNANREREEQFNRMFLPASQPAQANEEQQDHTLDANHGRLSSGDVEMEDENRSKEGGEKNKEQGSQSSSIDDLLNSTPEED